jgi:hypothetical protein
MSKIDWACVVFYYSIGPIVAIWLASIAYTVVYF